MLGWLAILGWLLFITVVIYVLNIINDFSNSMGEAFGWPAPRTNWTAVNILVASIWIISIVLKVVIWGWW